VGLLKDLIFGLTKKISSESSAVKDVGMSRPENHGVGN